MNICNRCKKENESSEFTRCAKCREERNKQAKAYYRKWHDEVRLNDRVYYHKNRAKFKLRNKNATLLRKYGINLEAYNQLMAIQNNSCAICEIMFMDNATKGWGGKNEPCVDHNHDTGKVRGILCRGCNLALSMIEDKTFLSKANQYLINSEK